MDTSKEYIDMCHKAVEVQESRKNISPKDYVFCGECYKETWLCQIGHKRIKVWLPRQDQLQDMVKEDTDYHTLMKFDTWVFTLARVYDDMIIEKFSMEQLWLAFVMYEKYGKQWDGSDWI